MIAPKDVTYFSLGFRVPMVQWDGGARPLWKAYYHANPTVESWQGVTPSAPFRPDGSYHVYRLVERAQHLQVPGRLRRYKELHDGDTIFALVW